jgi:LEA14-like dessication related protein
MITRTRRLGTLRRILIAAMIASLLLLSGCASLDDLLRGAMPRASVERVEFAGIDFRQIEVLFTVRIDNPNPIGVRLSGLDYRLFLEGSDFLSGDLSQGIEIAAGGSSLVQIPVSMSYQAIFDAVQIPRDQTDIGYQLDLGLFFEIPGVGRQRLPLTHRGELPILRIPAVSLKELRLENISLRSIDLELVFAVENPNGATLNLKAFRYDLSINGRSWLSAAALPARNLAGRGAQEIRVPISLNTLEVGQSVVTLLRSNARSLSYRLNVDALLGTDITAFRDFPWQVSLGGDVPLFK